ncbi:MAG: hemolysin family protein [Propionibacteriaceae bacterium]|nr:HlyC/CorC family transporter [Micropruina sp.]HBY24414.1 hypothetical protein [Propionibacteriaceae bacterium]
MNPVVSSVLVILVLLAAQGMFVAAEMALVTLRESQVKQLSTRGTRGATVMKLTQDPNRFLSTVSVGITLCTLLSGAFGGDTPALALEPILERWGLDASLAHGIAIIVVTLIIAFISIVFAELIAKRLAMQRAETFAMALAPIVNGMSVLFRPVNWLLGKATNAVVRLLGFDPDASRESVSNEELRAMVSNAEMLGLTERAIVDEVFAAGQVSLREVMVPRTEVDFLDGDLPAYKAIRAIQAGSHSRYPVVGENTDDVLGFIHVRDLFDLDPAQRNAPIGQLIRPIGTLPATVRIIRALSEMQAGNMHMVIVSDEYGGTEGIVTIEDLVEELIGEITDEFDATKSPHQGATELPADIEGLTTLEQFQDKLSLVLTEGPYDTLAGFVMARLGHLPAVGDSVALDLTRTPGVDGDPVPVTITVTELDGRRAARLHIEARAIEA